MLPPRRSGGQRSHPGYAVHGAQHTRGRGSRFPPESAGAFSFKLLGRVARLAAPPPTHPPPLTLHPLRSVKHEYEAPWDLVKPLLDTCSPGRMQFVTHGLAPQMIDEGEEVIFTYDVIFKVRARPPPLARLRPRAALATSPRTRGVPMGGSRRRCCWILAPPAAC